MLSRQREREMPFSDIVPDLPRPKKRKLKTMRDHSGKFATRTTSVETETQLVNSDILQNESAQDSAQMEIAAAEEAQREVDLVVELKQFPMDNVTVLHGAVTGSSDASIVDINETIKLLPNETPSVEHWVRLASSMDSKLVHEGFHYSMLINSTANSHLLKYSTTVPVDGVPFSPVADAGWLKSVSDSIETVTTPSPDQLIENAKMAESDAKTDVVMDEALKPESKNIIDVINVLDNPVQLNFGEALKNPSDFDSPGKRMLWWDDAAPSIGFISDVEEANNVRAQRNQMHRSFVSQYRPDDRVTMDLTSDVKLTRMRNVNKEQMDFMISNEITRKQQTTMLHQSDNTLLQSALASIAAYATETSQPRNNFDLLYGNEYSMNGPARSLAGVFYV